MVYQKGETHMKPRQMVTITVNGNATVYAPVVTSAPREYDYDYAIELRNTYLEGSVPARLVLIPGEHLTYQRERYASGLYSSELAEHTLYPIDDVQFIAKPEE
jgi:hypothetical protein